MAYRQAKPKVCQFCRERVEYIDYKDLQTLKSYLNERGKIKARRSSGACPQHQRQLAQAVKNAREMALMPYAVR
ncbi:MAG: 30S ribosomal protein S18 [Actinobacteria bacterium]|nr:30S ribosomal protein S18 [Actinomycetota bacterium]MDP9023444.1 30S ribosomal protein S18 [Actinomycetota bacterium]